MPNTSTNKNYADLLGLDKAKWWPLDSDSAISVQSACLGILLVLSFLSILPIIAFPRILDEVMPLQTLHSAIVDHETVSPQVVRDTFFVRLVVAKHLAYAAVFVGVFGIATALLLRGTIGATIWILSVISMIDKSDLPLKWLMEQNSSSYQYPISSEILIKLPFDLTDNLVWYLNATWSEVIFRPSNLLWLLCHACILAVFVLAQRWSKRREDTGSDCLSPATTPNHRIIGNRILLTDE